MPTIFNREYQTATHSHTRLLTASCHCHSTIRRLFRARDSLNYLIYIHEEREFEALFSRRICPLQPPTHNADPIEHGIMLEYHELFCFQTQDMSISRYIRAYYMRDKHPAVVFACQESGPHSLEDIEISLPFIYIAEEAEIHAACYRHQRMNQPPAAMLPDRILEELMPVLFGLLWLGGSSLTSRLCCLEYSTSLEQERHRMQ